MVYNNIKYVLEKTKYLPFKIKLKTFKEISWLFELEIISYKYNKYFLIKNKKVNGLP